jgi:DinB superfamily
MKIPKWIVRIYILYRSLTSLDQLRIRTLRQLETYQKTLENTPPERLETKKNPTGWNGMQIIYHTLNGARKMLRTAEELRNDHPVPDLERSRVGQTKEISHPELLEYCRKVQDQAAQFEYQGQSNKTCRHPFAGSLNWKQWIAMNLVHMERHYRQLLHTIES